MELTIDNLIKENSRLAKERSELLDQLHSTEGFIETLKTEHVDALVIEKDKKAKIFSVSTADQIYRLFFEKMSEGVITLDQGGTVLYSNMKFSKMLNAPLYNIIGSLLQNYISKLCLPKFKRFLKNALNADSKEEVFISNETEKKTLVMLSSTRLFFQDKITIVIVITDLTEQRAEKKLKLQNKMLEKANIKLGILASIVEYSNDAILSTNLEGIVTSWNKAAEILFGYNSEEVLGKNIAFILPCDKLREYLLKDEQIKLEKRVNIFESSRRKKNGSIFPVSITLSAIHNMQGKVIGISRIIHDITERKKAEEELLQKSKELANSNQELEQFAFLASHDLQEPLRTITNYIGLFHKNYQLNLDKKSSEYLHFIMQASLHMQALINDLLEYSRIGRKESKMIDIDVNKLLKSVLEEMSVTIKESKAIIAIEQLPEIQGYSNEMKSLFQNLISNAIKFIKPGSTPSINISGQEKEKELLFAIKDNGIGIDKQYFEKIFIIFQRLHTQKEYPGTGIGLAHCKKIIELHKGKIWIDSVLGQGSTFYFTIPNLK